MVIVVNILAFYAIDPGSNPGRSTIGDIVTLCVGRHEALLWDQQMDLFFIC